MNTGDEIEPMNDPAILMAILIAARKVGDETLSDAADAALADQGIRVVFGEADEARVAPEAA